MKVPVFYGRGGKGGGKIRTPHEVDDTLSSKAWVRIIDLVCEGPIDGFSDSTGNPLVDCKVISQPVLLDGGIDYPVGDFPRDELGLVTTAITQDSRGYLVAGFSPNTTANFPCVIDGDGTGAEAEAVVYAVNDHSEGRVRGIRITQPGTGYTRAKLSIPPATGTAIFFDNVPLVDPNFFTFNFKDVNLDYRNGTADQDVMPGFDQIEASQSITMAEIKHATPFTFEVDGDYDFINIDLGLRSGFYRQDTRTGDILEAQDVVFMFEQEYRGSGMSSYGDKRMLGSGTFILRGKTLSEYVRSYRLPLFRRVDSFEHAWKITITRVTEDDTALNQATQEKFRYHTVTGLNGVTLIQTVKLLYPHSAIVGLEMTAQQFSSIPTRSFQLRLQKIQVPSNYFPPGSRRASDGSIRKFGEYNRRTDDGSENLSGTDLVEIPWDGTFYEAWTNNPAWVFHAVCTHWRFGLGEFLPGVNKWGLYKIARYCDELVPTGWHDGSYSVQEPRFTANVYVQSREEAWKVLGDLASIFRGVVFWANGQVHPIHEAPKQVRAQFTSSNVVGGLFTYSSAAQRQRHTVAVVKYNDPADSFKLVPIIVEDPKAIARYGWQQIDLTAIGCTSRGQARRMGVYTLAASTLNTEQVAFGVGTEGAILRPGDLISIQDEHRANMVMSGRVSSVDSDSTDGHGIIVLDRKLTTAALTLTEPSGYRISITRPSPVPDWTAIKSEDELTAALSLQITSDAEGIIRFFAEDAFGRTVVHLGGQLPAGVRTEAVWMLKTANLQPALFSIVNVAEEGQGVYNILAVEYNLGVFTRADSDFEFETPAINIDPTSWKRPSAVRNLVYQINPRDDGGGLYWRIFVSWSAPEYGFVKHYRVYFARGSSNYQLLTESAQTFVEQELSAEDSYRYRVTAVGISGLESPYTETSFQVGSLVGENSELISGLEIKAHGNDHTFDTAAVTFDWRVNSSDADLTFHSEVFAELPPGIREYEVRVINVDPVYSPNGAVQFNVGSTMASWRVQRTEFTLTEEANRSIAYGPYREFILEVVAITTNGTMSRKTNIRVKNSRPPAPTVTVESDSSGGIAFHLPDFVPSADFSRVVVFRGIVSGFVPAANNVVGYYTSSNFTVRSGAVGTVYYFRVGILDQLANNDLDCDLSTEVSGTATMRSDGGVLNYLR